MTDPTPTTPKLDLDALRKIAESATDGPWEVLAFDSGHSRFELNCLVITEKDGDNICDMNGLARTLNDHAKDDGHADATHIAAFDPPTVLALITRAEAAEAKQEAVHAIERVNELHAKTYHSVSDELYDIDPRCDECGQSYPCTTIERLKGL